MNHCRFRTQREKQMICALLSRECGWTVAVTEQGCDFCDGENGKAEERKSIARRIVGHLEARIASAGLGVWDKYGQEHLLVAAKKWLRLSGRTEDHLVLILERAVEGGLSAERAAKCMSGIEG